MRRRWYIDGDMFVQETECPSPRIAQKMHTHPGGKSHLTKVTSGTIRIFDSVGWEVFISAGETIDLEKNLEHAIQAVEENTTYLNIFPASRLPDEHIKELTSIGTVTYRDES